jgi:dipeptidyl aminopeptidase/acylaminoacyl peptidase
MHAFGRYAILLLWLCALCAAAVAHAQSEPLASDINETVVSMPVIVNGKTNGSHMVGTVFRPNGEGPFPFVVLNHGRAGTHIERVRLGRARYLIASRWLVLRGLAVFVPTRRGYGETGGADVEISYNCANPWYAQAMAGGVESVTSAVEFARQQPFVDKSRFVLMGQSVEGYLAADSRGFSEKLRTVSGARYVRGLISRLIAWVPPPQVGA